MAMRKVLQRLPRMLSCNGHHLSSRIVSSHQKILTPPVQKFRYQSCAEVSTKPKEFECVNILDTADFENRVLNSDTPVVVEFHATWCGPCKLLGPRLEAIVSAKEGRILMAKVDVDDNADVAVKYGVRSVPTVAGFKNGELSETFIGLQEDDIIDSFVERLVH